MFQEKGYIHLPSILSSNSVQQFQAQIIEELSTEGQQERCVGKVTLNDPTKWPKKGKRRVVECAPKGIGEQWNELREGLTPTLNTLLGKDQWELPFNTSDSDIRHFYCPITFPEHEYPISTKSTSSTTSISTSSTSTSTSRPVLLESWKDEIARAPFTQEDIDAPSRWQPVSRRRYRGKGWHVDIGPGFSTEQKRTTKGHSYQGLIVLILLSDWLPGGGGTAMVPGSHRWVYEMLKSHDKDENKDKDSKEDNIDQEDNRDKDNQNGIVHRDLNKLCVDHMLEAVRNQKLIIQNHAGEAVKDTKPTTELTKNSDIIILEQIVGKAGDVVLVHPLLIHSGTTNLRSTPRLLANGMVRIKQGIPHPLLQLQEESSHLLRPEKRRKLKKCE